MILVIIPTNNWIALFHPRKKKSLKQPRALFHCSIGICLNFNPSMWNCWSKKRAFLYLEGDMTHPATSAKFLSYIFSTWYLYTLQSYMSSHFREFGVPLPWKTPFCQIFRANHRWEWQSISTSIYSCFLSQISSWFFCVSSRYYSSKQIIGNSQFSKAEMRSATAPHTLKFMTFTAPRSWTDFYGQGLPTKRPPGHLAMCFLESYFADAGSWLCHASSGCVGIVPFHAWKVPFRMYIYVQ